MILNETPARTSKNFDINNISINDSNYCKNINEFNNVKIINNNEKITINSNVEKSKLKYNVSDNFINQILENSNSNINLNIQKDSINLEDVILDFKFDDKNDTLVENIQINAKKDTTSSIVIIFRADKEDTRFYHNGLLKINLEENAKLKVLVINILNSYSNNFYTINNELKDNSNLEYIIVDFGGKNSISNYYSNIIGDNANNKLNTIYLGKDEQQFDLNYILELYGSNSNVNIDVQGALTDSSKKNFKGTIDFKQGAKKSKGNENEYCMLLSDKAKSKSLPILLCHEDDVEGNHSSSAGKLQDKDLFYIMSRGIDSKDAVKLLVRSKFNSVIDKIENDKIKKIVLEEIDRRLV